MFEDSWQYGEVPTHWKRGNIKPIFKKGEKEDTGKYRLVSITSVPGKIMEQILQKTMLNHLENKEVTCDSLTNLVAFYDGFTVVVNEGKATELTHLDSCKAFDTVPHYVNVSKLERQRFDG
ncbi:RNA-directed DNA polymerase from mobile element jockey-like protein [Pitangus sulphuratus]|nr:RNA-directed DNA polymerase from mobile element jockey-like protein [Pitangus sulphuratus]